MVLPVIGAGLGVAGMVAGLAARRFHSAPNAGMKATRAPAARMAASANALASADTSNPALARRNAIMANADAQRQLGEQATAMDAQHAQNTAVRRTDFANQTAGILSAAGGALGAGLTAYGGGGGGVGGAIAGLAGAPPQQPSGGGGILPHGFPGLAPGGAQQNPFFQSQLPGLRLTPQFTSDERLKSAIHNAGFQVDEFLDHLENKRFTLNGQSDKPPTTGVMAQDLQQSQIGREMVQQGPSGALQVDSNRALQAALASVARLNSRVRQLEGGGPRVEIGQAEIEPPMQVDIGEAQIERPRGQVPAHLRTRGVGPSGTPVALDSADHLPPVFARPPTGRGVVGGALARISHNPIPESTIRDAQLLTRVPDSGGSFRNRTPGVPAPAPTIPAAVPGPVRLEPMMQDPSARRELRDLDRNSPELLQRVANGQMGEGDMTYLSRIAPAIASRIMGRR